MIKAVFLDMDDTLIVNQELYDCARFALVGYLRGFGVKPEETQAAINKIDAENFKTLGISRFRYPATFEAVLKHFVPEADAEMTAIARGFAEDVFATVAPVKPGISEALDILAGQFDIYIVTAGDEVVQKGRLSHLPFSEKIKKAFIVEKKNKKAFEDCAAAVGVDPAHIVMIGDSLKSDIAPAVDAGMFGILIEARTSGNFHPLHSGAFTLREERVYAFSSLLEAARHLSEHGTPESRKFKLAPKPPKPSP